ncbi:MAG TPA: lysozyme inhibitor LprI family protein [Terriglobales bacterium]|nr:lysozyme inhibitor LprI family protein [Terriglobales bacterium]
MAKYLVMAVLLAAGSLSCLAQESKEYAACNQKAVAQPDLNACAREEAARVDAELNQVYAQLLKAAKDDPDAVAKIKAAEKAWVVYRDAYLEAMYPAKDKQAEYGSEYLMEVSLLTAKLTRRQIEALKGLLQQYSS